MKHLFTLIALLFSFQFLPAQENGPFKDYFDSGELKVEGQYKNKKRIGKWKQYHKSGEIASLYSYDNGKRNKEVISFYKNGLVSNKTEEVGEDYIRTGYYESGKLKYKRQLETGYYKSYYESGAIDIEANYLKYELTGVWKKYYENGKIEWLVNYDDGHREGIYKHFYNNGDLKLEGNNSRDKVNGDEKRYLLGNVLEWNGNYKKGVLSKIWTKYDVDGKKIEKIKFKNGVTSKFEFSDILTPTKVAEGALERVPIYPGCEDFLNNTNRKKCMSLSVAQFINKNFNTNIGSTFNIKGRQKIYIIFKIDKVGDVVGLRAKAPHPVLKAEAIRVIGMLPKFKPGMQRGKPVIVPFSIPVVFQVN